MAVQADRFTSFSIGVAFISITGCSLTPLAAADGNAAPLSRVRSSDRLIARLINLAIEGSPTFKRLVATVDASNGIVHVEPGVCAERLFSCLPPWMHSSGYQRFMRIVIDPKRLQSDRRLMGAIGHELQHVIEVLSEPSITTGRQMFFFFRRYAPTGRNYFETKAATDTGMAVEDELRAWYGANRKQIYGLSDGSGR